MRFRYLFLVSKGVFRMLKHAPRSTYYDLLKILLDAHQISKEILEKTDQISTKQVILGDLRTKFNTINSKLLFPASLNDISSNL